MIPHAKCGYIIGLASSTQLRLDPIGLILQEFRIETSRVTVGAAPTRANYHGVQQHRHLCGILASTLLSTIDKEFLLKSFHAYFAGRLPFARFSLHRWQLGVSEAGEGSPALK
jgi:hypothetical protein